MEIKISNPTKYEAMTKNVPIIDEKYISDYLNKHIDLFIPAFPVLVDAQTGSGKNYFVENYLISKAVEECFLILLLSNRIATDVAQKKRIAKMTGCFSELDKKHKDLGWRDITQFGNVTIMTYQAFLYNEEVLDKKFKYVVIDEAHYFWTDSSFSHDTERILDKVVANFQSSIRIYMTATPENIFPIIQEKEETNILICPKSDALWGNSEYICNFSYACIDRHAPHQFKQVFKNKEISMCDKVGTCIHKIHQNSFQLSRFQRDYGYISEIISFYKESELIEAIKNSDENEKWLVFVDSSSLGEKLEHAIDDSVFINAKNKSSAELAINSFNSITTTEKFEQRVLIATSVLDNGVNIKDSAVKNVAIYADTPETFMQMLGRVRVMNKNQNLRLYIKNHNIPTLEKRLKGSKEVVDAVEYLEEYGSDAFNVKYFDDEDLYKVAHKISYHDKNGLIKLNKISVQFYKTKIEELAKMIEYVRNEEQNDYVNSFARYVCTFWLKINAEHISTNDKSKDLIDLIESYVGKSIAEDEIDNFSKKFSDLYIKAYNDKSIRDDRILKYNAINTRLESKNLPYHIESKDKNWTVIKLDNYNMEEK